MILFTLIPSREIEEGKWQDDKKDLLNGHKDDGSDLGRKAQARLAIEKTKSDYGNGKETNDQGKEQTLN